MIEWLGRNQLNGTLFITVTDERPPDFSDKCKICDDKPVFESPLICNSCQKDVIDEHYRLLEEQVLTDWL